MTKKLQDATLCFLVKKENGKIVEVCLAEKKRGFGAGRLNGTGGKVDEGETILEGAVRETYEEIKNWLSEVRKFTEEDIPFVLIGNKSDLVAKTSEDLDRKKIRALAEDEGMIYIETSMETGELIEETFTELTKKIIEKKKIK